ncbi:MAG: hypothetical protein RMJ33_02855 [Saprospiraceae bacterium]|nr:DUF4834 family protein [Saprospiraceae bacterium]MDW8228756.1 hypothetical protein [Saprospiraceae bacterium]
MLFKWLFTLLAIAWLWFVWRRYFAAPTELPGASELPPPPSEPEPAPTPEPSVHIQPRDDVGEYIDYEEVKD